MNADAAVEGALRLAREALAERPAGVLSDLDGTLAPIITDPSRVELAPGARDALAALAGRLAVVGLVTGRAAAEARRIAGVPTLLIAGNHGVEWLEPGATEPTPAPSLAGAATRLHHIVDAVPGDEPGIWVEDKGLSATIHYRNAPDPAAARARMLAAVEPLIGPDMHLRHGRMSIELRPAGLGDKGTAVREVVERFGLRGLLVLGDDVTDLDMFRAAASLRAAGSLRAAIVGVRSIGEVPPEVAEAADALVDGPDAVVELLDALAREA